jgi:hypothetical protein
MDRFTRVLAGLLGCPARLLRRPVASGQRPCWPRWVKFRPGRPGWPGFVEGYGWWRARS